MTNAYRTRRVQEVMVRGFREGARSYERARPDYPEAARRFISRSFQVGPGSTVVDVAAGTGKWTRGILRTGARVIAVEPNPAMRREFRRAVRGAELLEGTAERTGLPTGCADVVTIAQAFHWFAHEPALREFHRILRPGGTLVLLWNSRQQSTGWRKEAARLCREYDARGVVHWSESHWSGAFRGSPYFPRPRVRYFRHIQHMSRQDLEDRYLSVSYLAALAPARKQEFLERLRHLLDTHPGSRGRPVLVMPYRTEVYFARRRDVPNRGKAALPRSGPSPFARSKS